MSGGSFDYLYGKDPTEDMTRNVGTMEDAAQALDGEFFTQVASDLRAHALHLIETQKQLQAEWSILSPVLKALEWYISNDKGQEALEEAVAEYTTNRSRSLKAALNSTQEGT